MLIGNLMFSQFKPHFRMVKAVENPPFSVLSLLKCACHVTADDEVSGAVVPAPQGGMVKMVKRVCEASYITYL